MTADDRASSVDVVVFMVIVLAFLLAMFRLGFWPSALIMLIGASLYLTRERTTRNIRMAIIVPICISIVAFLVFTQVFYVPFPEAGWFAG